MSVYYGPRPIWKTQLPIDYIDTTLTINVWGSASTDLSTGDPAKLLYIIVEQTNNAAGVETIELEITINGTAFTWTLTGIADGAPIYCLITSNLDTGIWEDSSSANARQVMSLDDDQDAPLTAETVGLVRARQTTSVDGVSAQIEVNIVWDKLVFV